MGLATQERRIKEDLRQELSLRGAHLQGCRRRGEWTEGEIPWSWLSGNALLHVLGDKIEAGPVEAFVLHGRWLLQFRGGPRQDYWYEDFYDLWSLVKTYGDLPDFSRTIIFLNENQGDLTVYYISAPDHMNAEHRASRIMSEARSDPPGRIPKSGSRAMKVCRYCPVRARCDAEDELRGDTDDWSTAYRNL